MAGQPQPVEAFVIDTSSVIEIRRTILVHEKLTLQRTVCEALTALARRGIVHFPTKVTEELLRGSRPGNDPALEWAKSSRRFGTSDDELFDLMPEVMARAPGLADAEKPSPEDHADPYVVALALKLKRGHYEVSVVTEDTVAKPFKMSIRDACWAFRILTVSMREFLSSQGIWPTG